MKFLITGGGTGGHIYPAISIANKIRTKYPDANILYVGTDKSLESELVPKEGFNFKSIRVKGFTRKLSIDTLKSVKELLLGLNDARKLINEFNPDIVIGTGGYVCGPMVLLASLRKIPTIIHEQNALPGVTNKILSRFVDKIAGSFDECKKHFKDPDKVIITGNPIRQQILNINREKARTELDIKPNVKFILAFGGSGGQKSLNKAMLEVIKNNINNKDVRILHVTGKRLFDSFMNDVKELNINIDSAENIKIVPYFFEMPLGLAASDIVITSAGAIAIAEITAIGLPSILIPKAYTTENHQEYNARALMQKGASVMILEKDLSGEVLYSSINNIIYDDVKLTEMAINSRKIGKKDSDEKILSIIEGLVFNK